MRVLYAAVLLLFSASSFGQGPNEPENQKAAEVHFKRGAAHFEQGDMDRAIAEYLRANELAPHPVNNFNLGLAYRAKGEKTKALAEFELFVRLAPASKRVPEAHAYIDELTKELAATAIGQQRSKKASATRPSRRGKQERVAVLVASRVNIDLESALAMTSELGAALQSQLEVEVIAGKVAAKSIDSKTGELDPGCFTDVQCLQQLTTRLEVDQLLLISVARVSRSLRLDVARFRNGSDVPENLAPVYASHDARAPALRAAAPRLVPMAPLRKRPKPPTNTRRIVTWSLAATSVATLAAAAGFGVASWIEHNDLDDRCREIVCADSEFDSLQKRRLTADIFLAASLATGAAAAILWLTEPEEEVDSMYLTTGPSGLGFGIAGRF